LCKRVKRVLFGGEHGAAASCVAARAVRPRAGTGVENLVPIRAAILSHRFDAL